MNFDNLYYYFFRKKEFNFFLSFFFLYNTRVFSFLINFINFFYCCCLSREKCKEKSVFYNYLLLLLFGTFKFGFSVK